MIFDTSPLQAAWLLVAALPVSVWVAWSDMKFMLIKNLAVLALLAGFLVLGLLAFPVEEYLWRWSHFAVVIVAGFLLTAGGMIGAGDAKFAAAMAPYVALRDGLSFFMLFVAVLLVTFTAHRLMRRSAAVRRATPDWVSWDETRKFPMGLALSGALLSYLGLALLAGTP